jgi:hypothetical protein
LWIYLDRTFDPDGGLSGSYEKMRLKQLQGHSTGWPGRHPGQHLP